MNSAEEISKYKEVGGNCYSPTLNRRFLGYGYDFPEKSPKKEKKWSIGSFFRRSKKKDESDTTSEEDATTGQKKGFLNRKKRKPEKKKKPNQTIGGFDHVVISRNSHLYSNGFTAAHEDHGILSDPSGGFNSYAGRILPRSQESLRRPIKNSHESLEISAGSGSIDSLAKRSRKGLAKVRAEARRVNLRHESSSDEDSQKSAASSSRFRSDENLQREGSVSRRSRAARTERYFRRHSRDGENPKDYLRISKSDAENSILHWKNSDDSNRSLSRSPLVPKSKAKTSYSSLSSQSQSISGLSTIPPSHGSHNKIRVSNSTSNPSYKPPLSMNEYINTSTGRKLPNDYFNNQRSISCDANIHKSPSTEIDPEIIHVQFPLGRPNNRYRNLSLIDTRLIKSAQVRQPPPPPPRDPRRLVTAQYYENNRPNTYYFDGSGSQTQTRSKSFNVSSPQPTYSPQTKKKNSFNLHTGRSTSEDHLPKTPVPLIQRPSSTTPETSAVARRYIKRQPEVTQPENYNYLTDKKPRSRKPIFIQTSKTPADNPDKNGTQKALDFWKQKDREGKPQARSLSQTRNSKSPQMFTCQTHVQTQVFLPSVLQNDINNDNLATSADSLVTNDNTQEPAASFKPISPIKADQVDSTAEEIKHKSTNLEEALDELEAIYNSLRLGDEDLLERAEQREKDVQAQRLREKRPELYWAMSQSQRGALSDSSFSYEPFDTVDSPRRRRLLKKSQTVDRRADDMAFRKLNKERSATINDPQSALSKVSYLQASPLYTKETSNELNNSNNEPDVTLDDVVYRNIKFANNVPKVVETQPPFGIPVGPITKAANSDYLHAVPDTNTPPRSTFKPRKIPDLVKDDLAFRNLRKDQGKEPALPPLSPEDLKNNNAAASCEQPKFDIASLKKKRAVRSLSANIGSLINKDVLVRGLERYKDNNNSDNEFNDLSNIADAMEIARKVLKEKENKINATRRGFLSDNDTNNGNCELKESRMNFLNSLNGHGSTSASKSFLNAKPPRGVTPDRKSPRTTKESTPIPVSPLEEKTLANSDSSFDDLLTALATEARETSERITSSLKHFGEIDDAEDNVNKQLSEIDAVSEQAKLCEKLLEGVVDTDLMAAEVVEQIDDEPVIMESVANIVLTRDDSKINTNAKVEKMPAAAETCESDHDYENLKSDEELNFNVDCGECEVEKKCTSPFEEHKAELIASFQELKNNIDIEIPSHIVQKNGDDDDDDDEEEEEEQKLVAGEDDECVLDRHPSLECAQVVQSSLNNKTLFVSNCDMIISCSSTNNNKNQSDAESTSGFCSSSSIANYSDLVQSNSLESLDSLKSPKLVLQTAKLSRTDSVSDRKQMLENQSMISRNSAPEAASSSSPPLEFRRASNRGGKCGGEPSGAWYRDPATVAVACSYGIACAHQLASLDFVAILGLLFAVLSFIAALIL